MQDHIKQFKLTFQARKDRGGKDLQSYNGALPAAAKRLIMPSPAEESLRRQVLVLHSTVSYKVL